MKQTWRWFGPNDPVTLQDIQQAGATGIVTALHDLPNGVVWPREAIAERKKMIEEAGLVWSVVESIPIHEDIKLQRGDWRQLIANWAQSMRNLAAEGVTNICYNFMPVIDWTRTDLAWALPNGARCLRFDQDRFVAFDLFILKREGAEADYSPEDMAAGRKAFETMSDEEKDQLVRNIIAGLPGSEESYTIEQFAAQIALYDDIDQDRLRAHLADFLNGVLPVADEVGATMAIHPDDPPRSMFGLPRIVSTIEDMRALRAINDSPANGFTLCSGSYGVREGNDLVAMIEEFAEVIHFFHLRATKRDGNSFYEADHFGGDVDMVEVIRAFKALEDRLGRSLPFRPDHGHQILDDLTRRSNPGYPAIGRLKGLAELRGAMLALGATVE
ncbi:mannonate dehydratase [Cohaesibacter sp. CAU 1516]|uniref:mannonate dehydratase n=1 Tax=Cohaesibacter sp. CAU 1516 TaxID=2576038 RepID=UPI0010FD02BD|nr:mannonate dehydratase [Cohaesibacter sp. CAU 1516]TLP43181.1 mannonate dehydratase [Cohaesibacter sp. CAU 1516]